MKNKLKSEIFNQKKVKNNVFLWRTRNFSTMAFTEKSDFFVLFCFFGGGSHEKPMYSGELSKRGGGGLAKRGGGDFKVGADTPMHTMMHMHDSSATSYT